MMYKINQTAHGTHPPRPATLALLALEFTFAFPLVPKPLPNEEEENAFTRFLPALSLAV